MWLIRNTQCQALDAGMLNDFVERMMVHLVVHFGDLASTGESLRRLVGRWIADARGWGLTDEGHIQGYLELCAEFVVLREPPIPPHLAAILSWPGRLPDVKLERLQEELLFVAGEES